MTTTITAEYLSHLVTSGARPRSITEARLVLEQFDAWRGDRPINGQTLQHWRESLAMRGLAGSTCNKMQAIVRAALHQAMRVNHDIVYNLAPMTRFKQDTKAIRVLTREQIKTLWECAGDTMTGRAIKGLLVTGARHQELLGVRESDLTEAGIRIRAEVAKNRRERLIPWRFCPARSLFPCGWSRHEYQAIRKATGFKWFPKDCRSTFVTYAWSRGLLAPHLVCEIAGHTLAVAERSYKGPIMWDVTGDNVLQWYGLEPVVS